MVNDVLTGIDLAAAYVQGADPGDLESLQPPDPALVAREHAALAARRAPGQTLLAVRPLADGGDAVTVVEIVTDDMPYLVDSITAALAGAHATAGVLLHPRPQVARDGDGVLVGLARPGDGLRAPAGGRVCRESWIRVQIRPLEPAARESLHRTLLAILADVRATAADATAMRARALELADELDQDTPVGIDPAEAVEAADLLRWLADEYWTFIGYREYTYAVDPATGSGSLAAVEGTGLGVLRAAPARERPLPPAVARRAAEPAVLVLTKANRRSSVLRPVHLDYVGVKSFDEEGLVVGERRFLGLFPPEDRGGWVLDVPVVRRRARQVLATVGAEPDSHDGSGVMQILGSLPRAELLATDTDDLVALARGALRLLGRRGVRVFARTDPYARFLSFVVVLADVEHGGTAVAVVEEALADLTGGVAEPATVSVVGSGVVRLHVIVNPGTAATRPLTVPDRPALEALEAGLLRRLVNWQAELVGLLGGRFGERGVRLAARWVPCFPAAYREDVRPAAAVADIFALDELTEPGSTSLHAALVPPGAGRRDADRSWRFTLYRRGSELSLSAILPVLSGMGVEVADERPYRLRRISGAGAGAGVGAEDLWVFTFRLQLPALLPLAGSAAETSAATASTGPSPAPASAAPGGPTLPWRFAEAFLAAFSGADDSDGLAGLVISAALDRGEVAVLRLYLRWLRQSGWSFGDDYARRALLSNPVLAAGLTRLFALRFDPERRAAGPVDPGVREQQLVEQLVAALDAVSSLDEDRILRRILAAVRATVRTNAFARGRQGDPPVAELPLVIVLDPTAVPELPHPLPWREIFVSCAAVEGVHLRFGPIARGGLRWSDRPEDFRTEILGLAKAQTVKNTVIVPTGAKGGFVVRRPPAATGDPGADREALAAAGRACYQIFIGGLLDVVDNLGPATGDGSREVLHPVDTVCHDGADSYLVVAADKGTATFSDLANSVATARGFWLGDAFASGGSAGFDHKKMGITAKGAWESVRRHFAELRVDADHDPITVVGIGDMSGDVFGNGMLLSEQLRLVAAFDHRHIFVDPDPQPGPAFAERRRLFELPRSSWADYGGALISAGGGVYPRTAKSLDLSARAREVLGMPAGGSLTPDELVHAILLAPVDLLFNGGIGTWVKAAAEPHSAAGDRANDTVRADGAALRVRVIAEGGNLGMTQRGRIEFARAGGRCNTDFVDNSAGVDTSDREVNLKILLGLAESAGELDPARRDALLASVIDEVAAGVLGDNRSQNLASAAEAAQAPQLLGPHTDLARTLEADGLLERALDAFPTEAALATLAAAGGALTVPELAILSGWAKIWLARSFTAAQPAAPEDPALQRIVIDYLPASLRRRFGQLALRHPLAGGIASTVVVNGVVDVAGPTFASRLSAELSIGTDQLLLAHTAARAVLGTDAVLAELDTAAGVEMAGTVEVRLELRTLAERATRWLIRRRGLPVSIDTLERDYAAGVAAIAQLLPQLLSGASRDAHDDRLGRLLAAGVPQAAAQAAAIARALFSGLAITDLAARTGRGVAEVSAAHVAVGDVLGLAALVEQVVQLPRVDSWAVRARGALRDDLDNAQATITEQVLQLAAGPVDAATAVELVRDWLARDPLTGAARDPLARQVLDEAAGGTPPSTGSSPGAGAGGRSGEPDLGRLLVAVRAVRVLAGG